MNIKDIHLLHAYNDWATKRFSLQAQIFSTDAGQSPRDPDITVCLNESKQAKK